MAKRKRPRGEIVTFIGRDKELRVGEVIRSKDNSGLHPISGLPMLQIEVTEGSDVGAIYWVMADKAGDVLGIMSQIL